MSDDLQRGSEGADAEWQTAGGGELVAPASVYREIRDFLSMHLTAAIEEARRCGSGRARALRVELIPRLRGLIARYDDAVARAEGIAPESWWTSRDGVLVREVVGRLLPRSFPVPPSWTAQCKERPCLVVTVLPAEAVAPEALRVPDGHGGWRALTADEAAGTHSDRAMRLGDAVIRVQIPLRDVWHPGLRIPRRGTGAVSRVERDLALHDELAASLSDFVHERLHRLRRGLRGDGWFLGRARVVVVNLLLLARSEVDEVREDCVGFERP